MANAKVFEDNKRYGQKLCAPDLSMPSIKIPKHFAIYILRKCCKTYEHVNYLDRTKSNDTKMCHNIRHNISCLFNVCH